MDKLPTTQGERAHGLRVSAPALERQALLAAGSACGRASLFSHAATMPRSLPASDGCRYCLARPPAGLAPPGGAATPAGRPQRAPTARAPRLLLGRGHGRQEQRRQDRNNRDHYQQFDQRKPKAPRPTPSRNRPPHQAPLPATVAGAAPFHSSHNQTFGHFPVDNTVPREAQRPACAGATRSANGANPGR